MSLPSAEVAADFRDALQDLKLNSRPEISNLTIIAKENTEHAQAISRELENHIKTAQPLYKLPALYVLDSIVKNVGTPYTVYLGRNLYQTFMNAYTLMDMNTRRAMEGLLKTWKQPVPESMEARPVFPPEVTRDIENALIKFRTVAVQTQQKQPFHHNVASRPMPNLPWRDTPTPPQNASRYTPSNDPRVRQQIPTQYGAQYPGPSGTPNQFQPLVPDYQQTNLSTELEKLDARVERLVTAARVEYAANLADQGLLKKLKALVDLQQIVKTKNLKLEEVKQIDAQLEALTSTSAPQPAPMPPVSISVPHFMSPHMQSAPSFPPTTTPFNLEQLLAQARQPPVTSNTPVSLADMFRPSATPTQHISTPLPIPSFHAPPVPATPIPAAPPPVPTPSTPLSLAQMLQQFGSNAAPSAAPQTPQPPQPVQPPQPNLLASLISQPTATPSAAPAPFDAAALLAQLRAQNLLPGSTPQASNTALPPQALGPAGLGGTQPSFQVELTTASMKKPRPELIARLYEWFPNQCQTCGRRFENSPKGKEMKRDHMDWHFKVGDPELAKRGIHRSWYINEREWVDFRETDDAAPPQTPNGTGDASGGAATAKKEAKDHWIPVPTDITLQNAPCSICQEKFQHTWLPEENQFVWMDAVQVGGKVYHATCWEEYSGQPIWEKGTGTPDSVLGKRKNEDGANALFKKIREY